MTQKKQARLQVLNSLLAEHMTLEQAATLMGVTTRHTRRILAAYRELGAAAVAHSKPSPQLITRVGRGRSIFNELNRPMDLALVREYQEPAEVYEKRPARRRVPGIHRNNVSDLLRLVLYAVQRGICPGCGFYQPHYMHALRGGPHRGTVRRRGQ